MFKADVGVEAARHGAVNDSLLLLVQQRDQLLLRPDISLDSAVGVVEEADDGVLFRQGRNEKTETSLIRDSARSHWTDSYAIGRLRE